MSRYRFSVEFESDQRPEKWDWPELLDIDDEGTQTDWSTWNLEWINE